MEFSLSGRNALLTQGPEVGSTFWPSPQSAWGWPPPRVLDKAPYSVAVSGNQMVLTSNVCPQTGLRLEKRFELFVDRLQAVYTMINAGDVPVRVAPWEITRIGGGTTFFEGNQPPLSQSNGKLEPAYGHMWHTYDANGQAAHEKVFVNGSSGWLANVHNQLLLLKVFEPLGDDRIAPGEAEIEIYGHGDSATPYIEMEQQGPYQRIEVGQQVQWQVSWVLKALAPLQQDFREQLIKEVNKIL